VPLETILPAGAQRVELLRLNPAKGKETHFVYNWHYVRGDPINTVPDSNYPYLLPFEHGKKFKIVQGFNGKFTHFGQNQYAVDFNLPEGTPVCAARDGLVIEVKADSNLNGTTAEFNQYNNYIWIYHSDGTVGNYVHLKQHGAVVAVGDQVRAGQLIGYSGNTGLSSGPHLHFDVRITTRSGEMQSIPFEFMNYDGKLVVPMAGQYYYALHPGQPAFTVSLGRLLRNEDFKGYVERAALTGKVTIRTERLDDTIVVFLDNGTANPIKAKVQFDLKNLQSSTGNPVTQTVPAQAEVFIALLNPIDILDSYSMNASITANWAK
jgi:murein DD-endopeptidase MepM/ murein hydrolase activator NlpD